MLKRSRQDESIAEAPEDDLLIELDEEEEETVKAPESNSTDPSSPIDLDAIKKLGELRLKETAR